MPAVIFRSICVGIASVVAALCLVMFAEIVFALYWAMKNAPSGGGGEVGWDLVTLAHNSPPIALLLPLLAFPIGFYLGFRHFSKSAAGERDGAQ
jgi:hypothetical protein